MKKIMSVILTILLFLTLCFTFTGCSKTVEKDIWVLSSKVVNYKGKVNSSYSYENIQVDDSGNIIYQEEGANTYTYEYNEDELLVKETEENYYGTTIIKYEYDENGLIVKEETNSDWSIHDGKTFEYSYTFDNEGRVASMTTTNVASDTSTLCEYTYNEDGSIATVTEHGMSGDIFIAYYYYDENGNRIRSYVETDDEPLEYLYEYSNMGTYTFDASEPPVCEKYRYFRDNRLL